MEKYYMSFRSVTYAQKGQRALEAAGLFCFLQRAPKWMNMRGCGYALEVRDPEKAAAILKEKKAPWIKVYGVKDGRTWEVPDL